MSPWVAALFYRITKARNLADGMEMSKAINGFNKRKKEAVLASSEAVASGPCEEET